MHSACRAEWLGSFWPLSCSRSAWKVALKGNCDIVGLPRPTFLMSMCMVSSVGENFNSWMHFQAILGVQQSWGKFVPFPRAYTTARYQPHLFCKRSTWAAIPLRASIHCDCSKVQSFHGAFLLVSHSDMRQVTDSYRCAPDRMFTLKCFMLYLFSPLQSSRQPL